MRQEKTICEHCELQLPNGCRGMYAHQDDCPLEERKDIEFKIGRAIWDDLTDRRGVKHELQSCDMEVQVEIVETMGKIAVREMKKHEGKSA